VYAEGLCSNAPYLFIHGTEAMAGSSIEEKERAQDWAKLLEAKGPFKTAPFNFRSCGDWIHGIGAEYDLKLKFPKV
jgi:hypothetical protein